MCISAFAWTILVPISRAYLASFVLDTSEGRSEIPEEFWDVVLGKAGEDQLDRSCEEWRSGAKNQ